MKLNKKEPIFHPELPYAGTSGHSGSDTSRSRAVRNDVDGTTSKRHQDALRLLAHAGFHGMTWKDLSDATGLHHGSASGTLSVLHLAGRIERLSEIRNRCKVYVLPEFALGREVEKRKKKHCPHCGGNL